MFLQAALSVILVTATWNWNTQRTIFTSTVRRNNGVKATGQVARSVWHAWNASASIGKFWYNILHSTASRLQGMLKEYFLAFCEDSAGRTLRMYLGPGVHSVRLVMPKC
jgi:hypothetical protein